MDMASLERKESQMGLYRKLLEGFEVIEGQTQSESINASSTTSENALLQRGKESEGERRTCWKSHLGR